ncbi:hypothetical protein I7I53_10339 [Histoplasma capsulatum var. duboisii H88]|uniref:Uncharacterized protein n=1 Tax=Ajellomyces capsulatus (strain H88) TaxID=544711 RepID=A0A8A1LAZ9_AJEC8|nr:hypothetical protein I7I53_10339 [Histoplasma capsulatum var. duboisii H88]
MTAALSDLTKAQVNIKNYIYIYPSPPYAKHHILLLSHFKKPVRLQVSAEAIFVKTDLNSHAFRPIF